MFRIIKAFENSSIILFKLEGEVTDGNFDEVSSVLETTINKQSREIILDLCDLSFLRGSALTVIASQMAKGIYVLNCSTAMKNKLQSIGFLSNILG